MTAQHELSLPYELARRGPRRLAPLIAAALIGLSAPAYSQDHAGQYDEANIQYGARLYGMHCIACHGELGDMMPNVNLQSGRFRNAQTDRELGNLIRDGLPGTAMTPNAYSDAEITALIAYVRNIGRIDLGSIPAGDPENGKALYEGRGECADCHRINGRGPRFAPDLSAIGAVRTPALLARSIRGDASAVRPINRTVRLVTDDSVVVTGRRLNEDTFTVQLIDANERLRSFDKASLREYTVLETSPMSSYSDVFSEQEIADLVAYLLTLRGLD